MLKKVSINIFVMLLPATIIFGQVIMKNDAFNFDSKIDNEFIANYSDGDLHYFFNFCAIDSAKEKDTGLLGGCGVDDYYGSIYYFNKNREYGILGYDFERQRSYIDQIGRIAYTSNKKVFVIDKKSGAILWWNIDQKDKYKPAGQINRSFVNPIDICKDSDDRLYILDLGQKKIFKYNARSDVWENFVQGKESIDLIPYENEEWNFPIRICVNQNGIYVLYYSTIMRFDLSGTYVGYYHIDIMNLELCSTSDSTTSETWLAAIDTGYDGNLYVLDINAKRIHSFSPDLRYIYSWADPQRPITDKTADISFTPGNNYMFLVYPWGFYSYKLNTVNTIVGIKDTFVYPDCVNSSYRGMRIDITAAGEGGKIEAFLKKDSKSIKILERNVVANSAIQMSWNGKDVSGTSIPYGEYIISFYQEDDLLSEYNVSICAPPSIEVSEGNGEIIDSLHQSIEYHYKVNGNGHLKISFGGISVPSGSQTILKENDVTTGNYTQSVVGNVGGNVLPDDYYNIYFDILPIELIGSGASASRQAVTFVIDKQTLVVGDLSNQREGFNPKNSSIATMKADFTLSEGAYISTSIENESGTKARTIMTHAYRPSGTSTIEWDGRIDDLQLSSDGGYRFRMKVEQDYLGTSQNKSGGIFFLDTTPAIIEFTDEKGEYYISPDEPSSVGVKDRCTTMCTFNEQVNVEVSVRKLSGEVVRNLAGSHALTAGSAFNVQWDGRDDTQKVLPDAKYNIWISHEDKYGNNANTKIGVWVDNNRADDSIAEIILSPIGEEFRVNTNTAFDQSMSSVAQIRDGFIVVWASEGQDGSSYGIYGQRYDADGVPLGGEFKVNTYTTNAQELPSVAQTRDGFVVVWTSNGQDGSEWGLYGQRYDADGVPLGREFKINTYTLANQDKPSVAQIRDGFVVIWTSWGQDGSSYGIYGQRYDANGVPLGGEFRVNTYTTNAQEYPSVAQTSDGFVVAWTSNGQDGSSYGIYGQRYDANGIPLGSEFSVNTYIAGNQSESAVVQIGGGFVVVWSSYGQDGSEWGLYGQRYDVNGVPLGSEFRVNTYIVGDQCGPSVAQTSDGFVVVWTSFGQDGSISGVYGKRYDANGVPSGGEFRVNTYTANEQAMSFVAQASAGFVVVWLSWLQDGSEWGVYGQSYAFQQIPAGINLTAQFLFPNLENYTGRDNFTIQAVASDTNIDRYEMSMGSGSEPKILAAEQNQNVKGDLYYFPILTAPQGQTPIALKVWDKAGNYREDSFLLTRDYESFITGFGVDRFYGSFSHPPQVYFLMAQGADIDLEILDKDKVVLRTINLGSQPASGTHILDISGLSDGVYSVRLRVTHQVFGSYEALAHFVVDNMAPSVAFGDLGTYFSSQTEIRIPASASDKNLDSISLRLYDEKNTLVKTILANGTERDLEALSFNPDELSESGYTFVLSAIDHAGNQSQVERNIIVDRPPPGIVLSSPDFAAVQSGEIHIKAQVVENHDISGWQVAVRRNSSDTILLTGTSISIDCVWNSRVVSDPIVDAKFIFTLKDKADNTSVIEKAFIADNNPPVVECIRETAPIIIDGKQFINGHNTLYLLADSNDIYSRVAEVRYIINDGELRVYKEPIKPTGDGIYNISYSGVDNFGNASAWKRESYIVDATPPDFTTEVGEPKYVQGDTVFIPLENNIVIISTDGVGASASGVKKVEYRIEGDLWQSYEAGIRLYREGPVNVIVRVKDGVGNTTEKPIGRVVIDIAPPLTTLVTEGNSYYSLQRNILALASPTAIFLSAQDTGREDSRSGLDRINYALDGEARQYSQPIAISDAKEHSFAFSAVDRVGNKEQREPITIAVDTQPPNAQLVVPDGVYTAGGVIYAQGGKQYELQATDNFAGVKQISYDLNGAEYLVYRMPFVLSREADYVLRYYAKDYLDNYSQEKTSQISIDNTAPQTFMTTNIPLVHIEETLYADSRYEFRWTGVDGKSGVSNTFVLVDGVAVSPNLFKFTSDGKHTIEYYSRDNVGNIEEKKTVSVVTPIPDMTPPVTKLTPSYPPYTSNNQDYYRSDVLFTLQSEDNVGENESFATGVDKIYCMLDDGNYAIYQGESIRFVSEGIHEIKYYAVDKAGNIELIHSYILIIDDSPPTSELRVQSGGGLYLDSDLYLKESDKVELTAIDSASGVKAIYFRIDGKDPWLQYVEPINLSDGAHAVEYYAEDNLGNKENSRPVSLAVVTDYNIVSYRTLFLNDVDLALRVYSMGDEKLVYVHGGNKGHIFVAELINSAHEPLERKGRITLKAEVRKELDIGGGYVAAAEIRHDREDIYLYTINEKRQPGLQISFGGGCRNPLIVEGRVYWIVEARSGETIVEYDISKQTKREVFFSPRPIQKMQRNGTIVMFLLERESDQELYCLKNGEVSRVFDYDLAYGKINNFSIQSNLLAFDAGDPNARMIYLYLLDDKGPKAISSFEAKAPILQGRYIVYTKVKEDGEILTKYDIVNGVHTSLLKGKALLNTLIDSKGNILTKREKGKRWERDLIDMITDSSRVPARCIEDFESGKGGDQLVFLKNMGGELLVDNIKFASKEIAFAYNLYCDTEDFIYADADATFTIPMKGFDAIHQIQTFNSNKGMLGEEYLSFMALHDVKVIVLTDTPEEKEHFERHGFKKEDFDLFDLETKGLEFIKTFRRYDVLSYKVNAGEQFVLQGFGSQSFAPIVFVVRR